MAIDTVTHIEVDSPEDQDYSGWYCIKTDEFNCPATGCDFVTEFVTAAHIILLWPEKDDPNILAIAERVQFYKRNPKIVEYKVEFGPAASYYDWVAHGRPVHATKWKPE